MRILSSLLILFLPALALSQGSSSGFASLKFPQTAFDAATGEAFVADPAALQSIRINPANIASRESYDIVFSHIQWIQDIHTENLSLAAPLTFGSLSFSLANTSVEGIELRDQPGPALGTFASQATVFQLTYGFRAADALKIGIASKYLYEKIFVDEATGFGFDAGVIYLPPVQGLSLGCAVTNLGNLSAFRTEKTDLPAAVRAGGTYAFTLGGMALRTAATYSAEPSTSYTHLSLGGEIAFKNLITLRLGYQTGYDSRHLSAGLGIRYTIVSIDYAYMPFSMDLGEAHILSIGFTL
jgi:hypothetical protein